MNGKLKDREILEAIKALENVNDRDAALNQLILSANTNQKKLSFLLEKIIDNLSFISSSRSEEDHASRPPLTLYYERIILELCKLKKENILYILQYEKILQRLILDIVTSSLSLEILLIISTHEQGKIQLIQIEKIIPNIVINLLNPNSSSFFLNSFQLFSNLLDLSETRKLIQFIEEFGKSTLYQIFCQYQSQITLDQLCFVLMQISRCKISHTAMYLAEGIIPIILNIISISHHPLAKYCMICLMNLSSETRNCPSMLRNLPLVEAVVSLARQHKGKIRQCSLGVLLNLSYTAINDSAIGRYFMEFPQYFETILMATNASGEIATQSYGMGILSNLSTCMENKMFIIQHPLAKSLPQIIHQILLLEEQDALVQSPRSTVTPSAKSASKFWLLKNDCSQILLNLSQINLADNINSEANLIRNNKINEWNNKLCLQDDLILAILLLISDSNLPRMNQNIRTNCLKTIYNLQPTFSLLLSSNQSLDIRSILTTIRDELQQFLLQWFASSNDKQIALDILNQINSSLEVFELVQSESKTSSIRSSSSKLHSQKKATRKQLPPPDTFSSSDGKFLLDSTNSAKKTSSKKGKVTF